MASPKFKEIRRAYGFDEVAIVPGSITINPEQTSTEMKIGNLSFEIPILASAMDAVVSPSFAISMDKLGGLAVMNLEGVQSRYDDPSEALASIIKADPTEVTSVLQKVYSAPMKDELIGKRVEEIKASGSKCAISVTPQNTKRLAPIA